MKMKKGAIWVSTVLYVLISLTILSVVFSVVKPKIDEARDRAIVEQSIIMLNDLDNAVKLASQSTGTQLKREVKISNGDLFFNTRNGMNNVTFILKQTNLKYSEIDSEITSGNLAILTKKSAQESGKYDLYITLKIDISGKEIYSEISQLSPSPFPYSVFIKNNGTHINFYKQ